MSTTESRSRELLGHVAAGSVAECLERFRAQCRVQESGSVVGRVGEAIVAAAEEAEKLAMSDLSTSLDLTERLVAVADALGEDLPMARTRRAWAQALAYSNKFEEALGALRAAMPSADRCGHPAEAGLVRMTTLHALARLGRLDEAVTAGECARASFAASGESVLEARAEINLGLVHWMRDDPRRAIEHYDRARVGLTDQSMLIAQLQSNRAVALQELSRFDEAEQALEASLAEFQRLNVGRAWAIVEGNLADLTSRQGRLHRAIGYFERAIRRMHEQESPGDVARLRAELAETMSAVGLLPDAADLYREAIPVLGDRKMVWEAARGAAGLGRVLIRLGRFSEAESSLELAAKSFAELKHPTGLARAKMAQAEVAERRGQALLARTLLEEARALLADRPAESVIATLARAGLELRAGKAREAEELATEGLAAAKRLDLAPAIADLLHVRSRARKVLGKSAGGGTGPAGGAVADLRDAVRQVERVRGTLQADRFRAAFLGDRAGLYEDAASAILDAGDGDKATAEAFATIEHAKSRTLLDELSGGDALVDAGVESGEDVSADAALLSELSKHRSSLNALYAQLDAGLTRGKNALDPAAWRGTVREEEREIRTIERRLASSARYSALFREPASMEQVQAGLGEGTGVVEYFIESGMMSAFVLTHAGASVHRRIASAAEIEERVGGFQFQIGRAMTRGLGSGPAGVVGVGAVGGDRLVRDAVRELEALDGLLLEPLRGVLGGMKRLVFVPYGATHAVPFHALMHGGEPLLNSVACSTVPSASVLTQLGTRRKNAGGHAVVVGVSDETIPGAEEEARAVAASLPGAVLLVGADATLARVRAACVGAGLIHVAGHARFVGTNPTASGLKLSDGWLTSAEISALRLESPIITLSGCDTGRSSRSSGEEVFGLSRAFFLAGATHLVVSLWPVHDQDSKEIMVDLYSRLYTGSGGDGWSDRIRSGLLAAQQRIRTGRPHPASWAAFSMVGAP